MMPRLILLLALGMLCSVLPRSAAAQGIAECGFGFSVNAESSALQALVERASGKGGFWLSIAEAPPDVRRMARHIGRLQVCLTTPDGKPRTIERGGQTATLDSPFVTNCTATLLPGNRLLTNRHCFYDPDLMRAGFTIVQEARVNFDYTSRDLTDAVTTYRVAPRELAVHEALDALVLQVIGDANTDMQGHFPLRMMTDVAPLQELVMIHHPGAQPQQYSTGTCKVHRRQSEVGDRVSALRHTCETTGGSSGALLLDARTLAVVALHNQGGLRGNGDGFNGGHKISMVSEALDLGFELVGAATGPGPDFIANRALADALLIAKDADRLEALTDLARRFAGTEVAAKAQAAAKRTQTALDRAGAARTAARNQQALAALATALETPDLKARMAALQSVIKDFGDTGAALRAQNALDRTEATLLRETQADQLDAETAKAEAEAARARLAQSALTDALLLPDVTGQQAALRTVVTRFPDSTAAKRAQQALGRIETLLQDRARDAETDVQRNAMAALTDAFLIADIDARRAALQGVTRDFPQTTAARNAALALDRLDAVTAKSAAVDPEAQAKQARLRCALQAASPFDPARPDTLPGIALEKIDTDKALALCSDNTAQIDASPATSFALARVHEARGEYADAQGFYRLAHRAGYTAATTALGRFARDGLVDDAPDVDQAIVFFQTAAKAGDPVAMTFLADIYETAGGAVLRDYTSAKTYLDQAVALEHPHALFAKAEAYRRGTLYPKDPLQALDHYSRAAQAGDVRAQYEEAMIYWRGASGQIDRDVPRALDLLLLAAENGNRAAQHRIGNTYLNGIRDQAAGIDIAPDFVTAKRWLARAAEDGFVQAQMQLGKIFANGSHGVEKDPEEALYWYELAAQQDFVRGLEITARMYENGVGTDKDPVKAAGYWMRTMELRAIAARQRPDPWDRDTARELQRLMRAAGVYQGGLDGAIGPGSIDAMRRLISRYSRNTTYFKPGVRIKGTHQGWLCQC